MTLGDKTPSEKAGITLSNKRTDGKGFLPRTSRIWRGNRKHEMVDIRLRENKRPLSSPISPHTSQIRQAFVIIVAAI
jgi:hypothetical protein